MDSLKEHGVEKIYTCGLCYDYCVGSTAIDAAMNGFETYLITDATRGVAEDTIETMKKKLVDARVQFIKSCEV